MAEKRKTRTSTEVKARWNEKTYVRYSVALRKLEDEKIIRAIEALKEKGLQTTDAIKTLILNGNPDLK